MSNYYEADQLNNMGFEHLGKNVKISSTVILDEPGEIRIGDNCRIDDYCVLTGGIELGNNVHIGPFCFLSGTEGIELKNYSGISARVSIYSSSDDYQSGKMSNPTVPSEYKSSIKGKVRLSEHCIIGSGSVILPKCTIGFGTSVGALSLVNRSLNKSKVYAGIPVKEVGNRNTEILKDYQNRYEN